MTRGVLEPRRFCQNDQRRSGCKPDGATIPSRLKLKGFEKKKYIFSKGSWPRIFLLKFFIGKSKALSRRLIAGSELN